jgi:D-alanyl-D-alanine dipeptidase/type IV secretory pathway VirB2 component (pilin)
MNLALRIVIGLSLLLLWVPGSVSAADGICACYYDTYEYCEYTHIDESEFTDIETACDTYCNDTYDIVVRTDSDEDEGSAAGITVGADCDEADALATAAATTAGEYTADESSTTTTTTTTSTIVPVKLLTPVLSIDIPTVTFSKALITEEGGSSYVSSNFLAEYISGVYTYLLGIATTIAIVMIMISGLQWTFGGVSADTIGKAKGRIKNAATGLVLLLCTYLLLVTVNPNLIELEFPKLQLIEGEGLAESEAEFVNGSVATSFGTPSSSNVSGGAKTLVPTDLVADIEAVAKALESQGYGLSITSGIRSLAEQKKQIALKCKNPPGSSSCNPRDGKTIACILKDNNPANCPHTTGRALDIWATKIDSSAQCISRSQCNSKLGSKDPCRLDKCQAALITAMKAQGFCNLSSEAWHFEKPKMSSNCN